MGTFTLQHLQRHHSVTTNTTAQSPYKTATPCSQDEGITYNSIATVIFHFKSLELEEELVSDNHLPTGLGSK